MLDNSESELARRLFEENRQMVYRIAFGILHNKSDAEDIVQDVFLWIIDNLERISQISCNERAFYFATITKHASINYLNKRKRHPLENIDEYVDIASDNSIEEETLENITVDEIKSALRKLSDKDYSIMYLYIFKQMKPGEIAQELGISEQNIRVCLFRARKRLIKILKEEGFDYDV